MSLRYGEDCIVVRVPEDSSLLDWVEIMCHRYNVAVTDIEVSLEKGHVGRPWNAYQCERIAVVKEKHDRQVFVIQHIQMKGMGT